jgi:hypothetical protein
MQSNSAVYQLTTLADLEDLKQQIFVELRRILQPISPDYSKKWLKSREVRKLLDMSPGKLHLLRASKQLSFIKLGGIIYYDRDDIEKMFEQLKH